MGAGAAGTMAAIFAAEAVAQQSPGREVLLLERTQDRINRVLPPDKALRYLALELKLAALVRYEAAAALP